MEREIREVRGVPSTVLIAYIFHFKFPKLVQRSSHDGGSGAQRFRP